MSVLIRLKRTTLHCVVLLFCAAPLGVSSKGMILQNLEASLCKGRWHAVPEGLSIEHRTWGMCAFWFVLRGRQSLSQPLRLTAPFTQGSQLSKF